MLTTAVTNATAQAQLVIPAQSLGGAAAQAAAVAEQLVSVVLPSVAAADASAIGLTAGAQSQLSAIQLGLTAGSLSAEQAQAGLSGVSKELASINALFIVPQQELAQSNNALMIDAKGVSEQAATLSEQVQELQSNISALKTELAKSSTRNRRINIASWFIPITKIGQEVASLIQHGQTAEVALQEKQQQIASLIAQQQACQQALAQLCALQGAIANLGTDLQGITNCVNASTAMVADAIQFANSANPATLSLFLLAINDQLNQLAEDLA